VVGGSNRCCIISCGCEKFGDLLLVFARVSSHRNPLPLLTKTSPLGGGLSLQRFVAENHESRHPIRPRQKSGTATSDVHEEMAIRMMKGMRESLPHHRKKKCDKQQKQMEASHAKTPTPVCPPVESPPKEELPPVDPAAAMPAPESPVVPGPLASNEPVKMPIVLCKGPVMVPSAEPSVVEALHSPVAVMPSVEPPVLPAEIPVVPSAPFPPLEATTQDGMTLGNVVSDPIAEPLDPLPSDWVDVDHPPPMVPATRAPHASFEPLELDTSKSRPPPGRVMVGAGIFAGVVGFAFCGPVVAIAAGLGTAYVARQNQGVGGDLARGAGTVTVQGYDSAKAMAREVDAKHHLVERTKEAARDAWEQRGHVVEHFQPLVNSSWTGLQWAGQSVGSALAALVKRLPASLGGSTQSETPLPPPTQSFESALSSPAEPFGSAPPSPTNRRDMAELHTVVLD